MTKDVLIMISGKQFDISDEPIELMIEGTYYLKNGKHYVLYEEQPEDDGRIIKNRVTFNDEFFEMVKNGAVSSSLKFVPGQLINSTYQTDAGGVIMEVDTREIKINDTDELIHANVEYALYINGQFISECEVDFKVQAR